jgi:hypothetical protein
MATLQELIAIQQELDSASSVQKSASIDELLAIQQEMDGAPRLKGSLTPEQFQSEFGDVPDVMGLVRPDIKQVQEGRSLGENLEGAGEVALAAITGSTFGTAGSIVGTLQGIAEEIRSGKFGTNEAANRIEKKANAFAESLTNTPESKAGKEMLSSIGEAGNALAPLAGLSAPLGQIGRSARASAPMARSQAITAGRELAPIVEPIRDVAEGVFKFQSPTKQRIASLLVDGSTDRDVSGFKLSSQGTGIEPKGKLAKALNIGGPRVVNDKISLEAEKQGFDPGVLAPTKAAGGIDNRKMLEMVDIMETSKRNTRYSMDNRPSDVAGDTLVEMYDLVKKENNLAGRDIRKQAFDLKDKPVDLQQAVFGFDDNLKEFGISLVDDGKGGVKTDFSLSELPPGDRAPIKEIIRQMNLKGRGEIDGLTAHKMKKIIDRNVTFSKKNTSISSDGEKILKAFRRDIDTALDTTFPKYDKANRVYAETITGLDLFQEVMGRKMDLSGPDARKAVGTKIRSVMSNNDSRIPQMKAISEINNLAKKYGRGNKKLIGKDGGDQDLMQQILFADELNSMFGTTARTSFAGQIGQEIKRGGQAAKGGLRGGVIDLGIDVLSAGAEKARGINQQAAFKSIRELLKQGNK